jgi:hypothetical protein
MLKCASAYTYEIDDPGVAFGEIKKQLDEKITLLKHSVGVVMCHPEFIASGALRHICENLPFELAGATTSAQAVNGEAGDLVLTIFVMTSDDVQFKAGVTPPLDDGIDAPVQAAFDEAAATMPEPPKLAIIFPPLMLKYAGDAYVNAWGKAARDVPLFGSLAIDDSVNFEGSETIFDGKNFKTAMSFVLCFGNIAPRFLVGSLPQDKAMPYKGEITKSEGPFVHEINNISARKYFESIGIIGSGSYAENQLQSYLFVPFVIDQKMREDYDGIPVIRGHASFLEGGSAIFRGDVDEGSSFTMLMVNSNDVMKTTSQKLEEINGLPDVNGILLFPCIVRRMISMYPNPLAELKTAIDTIRPDIPFMMGYAGGEICPTSVNNGIPANRFHNYSLVALVV